jgi:predicted TIM-barrel fold metal-dependent hydrolase
LTTPVIDASVHHDWLRQEEVAAYLPRAWRQFVEQISLLPGRGEQLRAVDLVLPIRDPRGELLEDASSAAGASGIVEAGARPGVTASVLTYGRGAAMPLHGHTALSVAMCAAMNDWTADRWLHDAGTWGSILVPTQDPEASAREIERHGANPKMVQVLLGANGLGKGFGHALYDPIFRAAAECELPLAIPIGCDSPPHTTTAAVAVAPPATYSEYRVLAVQAFMTHVMSLIGQGVFERYPRLRVMLVGGGVAWIPPALWRDDACYLAFGTTAPWVRRKPSDYFVEHFRVGTYQLEPAASVAATAAAFPELGSILCYASGYPRSDSGSVAEVRSAIPEDWRENVFYENASAFYGDRLRVPVA